MGYYFRALKKYATFSGRARRKEYWLFFLFNWIFLVVAVILDHVFGWTLGTYHYGAFYMSAPGVISSIYSPAMILPGLAVMVRRLHDVDKSGGWFFICFVPLIGPIWFLVLLCTEGTRGDNRFGEDPKAS